MDFELSSECRELRQKVKAFVDQNVLPQIAEYEEKGVFPRALFREIGAEGFLRAHVSGEYGGLGLGTIVFCLVAEELARAGAGLVHSAQFQMQKMLMSHGTPEQQAKYLEKLLSGEYVAAVAITEPTVGSSFSDMRTIVRQDGDTYVLNGLKTMINGAAEADVIAVFARNEQGISIFLVDRETPGLSILNKLDIIGMRSAPVYEFELKDCIVNGAQLLGKVGEGLKVFFSAFNFSRLGNASAALGIAQAAFDKTLSYLKERRVGSRGAAEFQGLRWTLVEMNNQLEAARLVRDRAAVFQDKLPDNSLESSRAKLFCVEVANRVVGDCIQATGRYGSLRD
ncbi:MAG: acyl-CoA dehydrogenase family protein, partial [Chloroflexi bacterium]|nr:acyl-CoA dehydrogenase family protein [Chloroflexota bacterium]